jgi:general secretion pathway protein D
MAGMSFALFQPRYADARSLRTELTAITGASEHAASGGVRLLLISRLNALLAIARNPRALHDMATWVERLDQGTEATEDRIFIYHVQNGRAADLQAVLGKLLNGGAADSGAGANTATARNALGNDSSGDAATSGNLGPRAADAGGQAGSPPAPYPSSSAAPRLLTDPLPNPSDSPAASQTTDPSHVSIMADEPNNALIIRATEREYRNIAGALARLDVVPLQVVNGAEKFPGSGH